MFQYGAGKLFGLPIGGNLASNPTPVEFGTLQDVSLEIDQKLVELRSSNQFPDDVAPGDRKVSGKASFGNLNIQLFNQLFFADSTAAGTTQQSYREAQTVPGTSPYTVTVAQSAHFAKDEGVTYQASGLPLIRVSSSPTVGEYTVSAGVYTFAAADEGAAVFISYTYTNASAGNTLTVHNQIAGYGPTFEMYLYQSYQGQNGIHLYSVRAGKLSMPLKRDNYQIASLDFEAFANAAGQVLDLFETT